MAREPVTRGLRDEADVGPDPRAARELRRLSELRYQVADGEPDIRGWQVYASTGRELGTVSDLLVDTDAGEVVMLDVDLRRSDRHTLAPIRAAWIDHATRRVVLDAREAERAVAGEAAAASGDADDRLPALPRSGALSDDDVRRFNDDYAQAYGERAVDDRAYRVRRGDEELRFGAGAGATGPRRLLDPAPAAPAAPADGRHFAESDRINAELAAPPLDATRREHAAQSPGDPHLASAAAAADAFFARRPDERPVERRAAREDRADEVLAMDEGQGIEPRELDARVRIDEGATVDAHTPVGGVRYDGPDPVPHSYGRPADAYGPEYGSGRIGFDKVVSRGPYVAADEATPAVEGDGPRLRYRQYPDAPRGGAR